MGDRISDRLGTLTLEDGILETEPGETRVETRISPMFGSTTRSLLRSSKGNFPFNFASFLESPRSTKSFTTLITLPKGDDDESINEESSSVESRELPSETMQRRVTEIWD